MFKLAIVHGTMKGKTFTLQEGEHSIGRVEGNSIVIPSKQISKHHCVFLVNGDVVFVKDTGSSNGTFVNGVMTKYKEIQVGDKVSIGDCVFELGIKSSSNSNYNDQFANVVPIRGVALQGMDGLGNLPPAELNASVDGINSANAATPSEPKDLKDKIKFLFEKYVLNFIYNMNEKYEWKAIFTFLFVFLVVGASIVSVYPVLDRVEIKLEREARERALLIARQISERNSLAIYEKTETKIDIGFAEKEKGVLSAYIIDMEGRIIAPARKLNQYLTQQYESAFGAISKTYFKNNEKDEVGKIYGNSFFVAVPIRVFEPTQGKNVSTAIAIVNYDLNQILFDDGTVSLAYLQAMILAAIIGIIVYFSLYQLTLKPIQTLNNDADQALKGKISAVIPKYKMQEIEPLIDIMNSALQRAQSGGSSGSVGSDSGNSDDGMLLVQFMADRMDHVGVMVYGSDKKIKYMNSYMEEASGMRMAMAAGMEMADAAKDQAFIAFISDVSARTIPGVGVVEDSFEFIPGTKFNTFSFAVGFPGNIKFYIMLAKRSDG